MKTIDVDKRFYVKGKAEKYGLKIKTKQILSK